MFHAAIEAWIDQAHSATPHQHGHLSADKTGTPRAEARFKTTTTTIDHDYEKSSGEFRLPNAKRRKITQPQYIVTTIATDIAESHKTHLGLTSPMSSNSSRQVTTPAARRRKRPDAEDDEEEEEEDNCNDDADNTPRGASIFSGSAPSWMRDARSEHQQGSAAPSSSQASSSRASKRSKSPTKNLADMHFADIQTRSFYSFTSSFRSGEHHYMHALIEQIQTAADGLEVVPEAALDAIRTSRLQAQGGVGLILPHYIHRGGKQFQSTTTAATPAEALREFGRLEDIVAEAGQCELLDQAEAAWNAGVHLPLLRLCMQAPSAARHVSVFLAPTATICPPFVPRNAYTGDVMGARLVDLCVTVNVEAEPETRPALTLELLKGQPETLQSLNQTMYPALRYQPIALAVETKTDSAAGTGANQLSIWTKAWLNRLRLLSPSSPSPPPPLPLLRVRGHDWFLLLAHEEVSGGDDGLRNLVLFSELPIGSTRSIVSIYKLAASLRLLARWIDGPFRTWYRQNILCVPP